MCSFDVMGKFSLLTNKTGTGRITAYCAITGKHLQTLPKTPHGMRIDEESTWFGITSSVDLIVGKQIIVRRGQPVLESAVITAGIPGSDCDIAKDRRMRKIKFGLGNHLEVRVMRWLIDDWNVQSDNWGLGIAMNGNAVNLLENSRHVLWFCCQHPLRVLGLARDWISSRCRVYLTECDVE